MSTQVEHTPGPWTYREQGQGQFYIESSEGSIAWCDRHYSATQAQGVANAQLIAAAPELLVTLVSVERGLNDLEEICRRIVKDTGAANLAREKADWCRAAIAKAKGETNK